MKRTLQEGFKKKKKKKEKKRKEKKTLFATLLTVLRQTTTKDEAIHLLTARLTNKTSQRGVERGVGFTARVTTFPRASNIFLVGPIVRPLLARKRAIPQSDTRVHTPSPLAPRARKAHVENGDFLRIFVPVHAVFFFPATGPGVQCRGEWRRWKHSRGQLPSFLRISMGGKLAE